MWIIKLATFYNNQQDHLFLRMQTNNHFYFHFSLKKIRLEGDNDLAFKSWSSLRLQLYRNQHFISTTSHIYYAPNAQTQLILQAETFTFDIEDPPQDVREVCQIRLVYICEGEEQVLGCYQFILNNYIKAYTQLNQNSIELNVQIAQNYIICYEVFLQKTKEALTKIIQEHQTAKKYHMEDDRLSELDSFPDCLQDHTRDEIFKFVKIDDERPHLYHEQYSSSKKIKRFASIASKATESNEQDHMLSSISTQGGKIMHKRLKKAASNSNHLIKYSQHCSINQIQLQNDPELDDRFKVQSLLYQVIQVDSKIIDPQEMVSHVKEEEVKNVLISFNEAKVRRSLKRFISPIMIFVVIALVIILFSFITYSFKRKRNRTKSSKMQFQFHKFSSFVSPKSFK